MQLTLDQKEAVAKSTIGKKVQILSISPMGQKVWTDATLKEYNRIKAGMILVYFEELKNAVVNLDILKVWNGTEYEDIYEQMEAILKLPPQEGDPKCPQDITDSSTTK